MQLLVTVLVAGLALTSCHAKDPPAVVPGAEFAQATLAEQRRMHVRFEAATRIERAIAFSDLDRARAEAATIAALEASQVLPTWQAYFDAVRAAAQRVQASGSYVEAARRTAELGQRCASCHVAIAANVQLPPEPRPPDGTHLEVEMRSHQWAATQMWWGLFAPSSAHWDAGARALTTARLTSVAYSPTDESGESGDDVARVRLYANRALATPDPDSRAALFGTLLATCAHCHGMLRDR